MTAQESPDEIVCYCRSVNRKTLEDAVRNGATTLRDIQRITGACTGGDCGRLNPKGVCCCEDILAIIDEIAPPGRKPAEL